MQQTMMVIALLIVSLVIQVNSEQGQPTTQIELAYQTKDSTTVTSADSDDNSPNLTFLPADRSTRFMHTKDLVRINISSNLYDYATYYKARGSKFYMGVNIDIEDAHFSTMLRILPQPNIQYVTAKYLNLTHHLLWVLQENNSLNTLHPPSYPEPVNMNAFRLIVTGLGYPKFSVDIIEFTRENSTSNVIHSQDYHLTLTRRPRGVDLGFTIAIIIIGIINTFAIGCVTDLQVLRAQLKESLIPVCLASGTQYILVPLIAFGVLKLSQLVHEYAVGVLICASVPGGGLGYLIVVVTGTANTELSVAINFLHIFIVVGTAPLWLVSLGQFLPNGNGNVEIPIHLIVICLVTLIVPYILGIILRRWRPEVAESLLNWIVKPLLLLFCILFVTLGLYINMYALEIMDKLTIIIAGLVPSLGFCVGGGLTLITRQGKPSAKSVAIEAAILNCLVVIAAVRCTMKQPDADIAVASALAVLFTTPVPFIGMLVFHKIKKKILTYLENRRFEREQQETILKSFAVITQNALQISGMTPKQLANRQADKLNQSDVDNTIPDPTIDQEDLRRSSYVVQLQNDNNVETIPLNQSNHRNYL